MDVEILGQYDFDNYTLLNALMSENEWINTAIHEYTHFVLANQSVYGTISYCLNKLMIPHDCQKDIDRKNAAMNFFERNALKVQEGMAVFIEAVYFLQRGKAEYTGFMDGLRINNQKYYEYVQPLCFILDMLKEQKREKVLAVAHAVFQAALESMNAEIYVLDGNSFGSNKLIKKMISKEDFSPKYIPNKRFEAIIKHSKKAESCEELIEILWDNVEYEKTINTVAGSAKRLERIKEFVLDIFSGSKYMDLYRNKLAKIEVKEENISEIFLQQIPTAFNEEFIARNMKKAGWETIKQKCKDGEYSTLFLVGKLKDNLSDLLIKMGVMEIEMNEDEREILFFYDLKTKEIYACILEEKQLQEILEDDENKSVLLTSYKNYDYGKECIPDHPNIKRFTYIYCDRTYKNAIDFINKWKHKNVYYRYMVYESMPVLLVKNSNNSIFILPMTPMVADEADRDIRNNRKNMMMITEAKDEEYDSHIITDLKKEDEINTIINCLFFIDMIPKEDHMKGKAAP